MKSWRSLRVVIPALALAFVAISLTASYLASRSLAYQRIDSVTTSQVRDRLTFVQGTIEQFLIAGSAAHLPNLLANFASEPDLIHLVVIDADGIVRGSSRYSDVGLPWQSIDLMLDEKQLAAVAATHTIRVAKNAEKNAIDGYVQVCEPSARNSLRDELCGVAFYRLDLGYHYALTRAQLLAQTVRMSWLTAIGGVLLLATISYLVSRPAARIATALRAFTDGARDVRCPVSGPGELFRIGELMNRMFEEVRRGEHALQNSEQRLRRLFDNVLEAIVTIDERGIIQSVNPATVRMFGYAPEELIGCNVSLLMPERIAAEHDDSLRRYRETGRRHIIGVGRETVARRRDGSEFAIHVSVSEFAVDGTRYFTGTIQDISVRKGLEDQLRFSNAALLEANEKLKEHALLDALTGLHNRRHLDQVLDEEMRRAARHTTPLSLLILDVDYFKSYNDSLGHQRGDDCLRVLAEVIRAMFQRAGEVKARYGGEEFVVVLPTVDDALAMDRARALLRAVWERAIPHPASPIADRVTLSIGVATYLPTTGAEGSHPAALFHNADRALYAAKKNGRNQVVLGELLADDPLVATGVHRMDRV